MPSGKSKIFSAYTVCEGLQRLNLFGAASKELSSLWIPKIKFKKWLVTGAEHKVGFFTTRQIFFITTTHRSYNAQIRSTIESYGHVQSGASSTAKFSTGFGSTKDRPVDEWFSLTSNLQSPAYCRGVVLPCILYHHYFALQNSLR